MTAPAHALAGRRAGRLSFAMPPAGAYAIRFGLTVSAAIWIGNAPGLVENHSTWILITVLMLLQPTTGGSMLKGVLRGAGTVAAAFTAIALFGLFSQSPPLLAAGLFAVTAIAAYGNSGPRFQYAWFVWGFTTAIVLGDAMAGQGAVETVAFQRASMVGLGILLVAVADSLLWPAAAEPQLRSSLVARARGLAERLGRVIGDPPGGSADSAAGAGTLASQLGLVDTARSELGVSRTAADRLARLAMLLETLASRARVLSEPGASEAAGAESPAFRAARKELVGRVQAALEELASGLATSGPVARSSIDLAPALLELEAEWDRMGRGPSAALEGRLASLRDVVSLVGAVGTALESRAEPRVGWMQSLQSFQPDAYRVRIALRTGIAVVAAVLVPMILGWPLNTLVAPIALIVASATRGGGVQLVAALAGVVGAAWLVADLSIVYVMPHVGRAPLALLVSFAVGGGLAYAAWGRPQLALLPSIGGLVACLSIFGGAGAPTDVYGPYSTVCYIALAAGVAWLSSRLLWPATGATLFRLLVAEHLQRCLDAVRQSAEGGDAGRRQRARDLIRAWAAQSVQLGRLHAQAGLEPIERGLDATLRTEIIPSVMDLMDAVIGHRSGRIDALAERARSAAPEFSGLLRRADEAITDSVQAAIDTLRGDAAQRSSSLGESHQALEDRLRVLAAPGGIDPLSDEERRPLLVELDSRRRLVFRQRAIEDWLGRWHEAEAASNWGE